MSESTDGYLRIRSGPLRDQYAHRAYVNRQLAEMGLPPLRRDEQVHHLCGNKKCWPPTDFHLVVMDFAIHTAIDSGSTPMRKYQHRRQRHFTETE